MTTPGRPGPPSVGRRRALSGAALVAVGAPLLAACAGEEDGGGQPTAKPGAELTSTTDVPEGGGVVLGEAGVVVTQPEPGKFRAFGSTCTHQSCPVSGVTETIDCVCHGSKFSLADGSVVQGPATEPLPERPIRVRGERIILA